MNKITASYGDLKDAFDFNTVSENEISVRLKSMNGKKATGHDNIPGKMIKLAHRELAMPIANLINASISQRQFPDCMKCAEVSPILRRRTN